jgi:hypothetical protein
MRDAAVHGFLTILSWPPHASSVSPPIYTWRCHDALPGDEMLLSVRPRLVTASCVGAALSLITLAAQQTQAPVFTSRTWLVPIDVRVVDSGGRPIPGLTAADFTITEDSVPQQVAHFSAFAMTPEPAGAAAAACCNGLLKRLKPWRLPIAGCS